MDNLKQKTLAGFVYKFAERGASQAVSFIVQIILARLLMPEEFGTIALLTVFINILDVFVTYGFGNSLVVNKKSDDLDFSTCFFFGLSLSLFLYAVVFFTSPYISNFFYGDTTLDILVKVMALRLPVAAINTVQHAHVSKRMDFKLFFYATLIATILSGVISIAMAYMGFGLWALVAMNLGNAVLHTITLWIFAKWRPRWMFSFNRLKAIYDYGWKILVVGLIDQVFGQINSLVIAKKYTRSDLAYYDRGGSFPGAAIALVEPTISAVLFPALSNCNDDPKMMKEVTKRVTNVSTYLICSLMFLLTVVAKPLVVVLLTEKWLPCVIFLQIACLAGTFRPIQVINNCVIRASGRGGLLLTINIIKKGIGLILLIASMQYGVVAIAWSMFLTNLISTLINIFPNRTILQYGYKEQFWDLMHNMMIPGLIGILIWFLNYLTIPDIWIIILQTICGGFLLVLLSEVFKVESYCYLKSTILKQVDKKFKR